MLFAVLVASDDRAAKLSLANDGSWPLRVVGTLRLPSSPCIPLGDEPSRSAVLEWARGLPARGPDNETNRRMLHAMVGRADYVGHVILEAHEVTFARSDEGARWLEPIDPKKRLYKLTQEARQQFEP